MVTNNDRVSTMITEMDDLEYVMNAISVHTCSEKNSCGLRLILEKVSS